MAETYDPRFPPAGYRLDKSDSDVLVLRRGDGTFAAFSALGATRKAVKRAAKDDWRTHANRRSAWIAPR